jgi:hypothetical protein
MTTFDLKRPPKGWIFPFSNKAIRLFLKDLDANFDYVLFEGTRKPNFADGPFWFGVLTSKKVNGEWYFSLEVNCLREEQVVPWKDEITKKLFAEMKQWIEKKKNLIPTAPEKPRQLFLRYEIKNGSCMSICFEVE